MTRLDPVKEEKEIIEVHEKKNAYIFEGADAAAGERETTVFREFNNRLLPPVG